MANLNPLHYSEVLPCSSGCGSVVESTLLSGERQELGTPSRLSPFDPGSSSSAERPCPSDRSCLANDGLDAANKSPKTQGRVQKRHHRDEDEGPEAFDEEDDKTSKEVPRAMVETTVPSCCIRSFMAAWTNRIVIETTKEFSTAPSIK